MASMEQHQNPVQIQVQQQPRLRSLPTAIAAAIETIHWPLLSDAGSTCCPKMYLEPLAKMAQIRAAEGHPYSNTSNNSNSNLNSAATLFASTIASDITGAIQSLCDPNDDSSSMSKDKNNDKENSHHCKENARNDDCKKDDNQEYMARIAIALLLLGHGYTDEAHCLVSPLSWPRETHFGYGPPVAFCLEDTNDTDDDDQGINLAAASYAHALVHRREGPNPSEFGRTGFQNADYWTGVRSGGGEETLPVLAVQAAVQACAVKHGPLAVEWCTEAADNSVDWEPRFLHSLCAEVVESSATVNASTGTTGTSGEASAAPSVAEIHVLGHFAQDAAAAELKVLLGHTLQLAGYDASQCFPTSTLQSTSTSSGEVAGAGDTDTGTGMDTTMP
jgi:hypothetical protein